MTANYIGRTVDESTPAWTDPVIPDEGAPNVILILLDDTGFAHFGCYGSEIDTPNIDAFAANGLRFTNYHTTAICSATRACVLTGRNHHSVGMRSLSNFSTGFPNMRGFMSHDSATVAEVLSDAGVATMALGKWHLAPMSQCSAAGPFDEWPTRRGFDKFYGFMQGETDQFFPELVEGTRYVPPPRTPEEGYHLSEDLVDRAIDQIREMRSLVPERPYFMYLAFGATHSPHQAPTEYLDKYRGRFDEGWDVVRQRVYERQLELGIIPPGTELAPRNPGVEPWEELSGDERAFAARLQEAYAAFLDHTDAQIGRLVDDLEATGQLDNTMIVVMSDNGASREGQQLGVMDEFRFFNGVPEELSEVIDRLDDIGTPKSHSNYPWGWAQVGNTPGKWYKTMTHSGGVRDPFVVHFPNGIPSSQRGAIRNQFHHAIDIVPTVYELLGVTPPASVKGVPQQPLHGTSFAYLFGSGDEAGHHRTQYFEMSGHRAIWHDGWKAVTRHEAGTPFEADEWELYHVDEDFSECHDLATDQPDVLSTMLERWWAEAGRHGVLPLDDRAGGRLFMGRPSRGTPRARSQYAYFPPISRLPMEACPPLAARSYRLRASLERAAAEDGGVILAIGTMNSGIVLYLDDDGHLVYDHNEFGRHTVVRSEQQVPAGASIVGVDVDRGRSDATATLFVDDEPNGEVSYETRMRMISSIGMDLGSNLTRITDAYEAPYAFEGRIESITIDVDEPDPTTGEAAVTARVLEGTE